MLNPFQNEPLTDFSKKKNRKAFSVALEKVKSEIGQTYPLIIGGEHIQLDETFTSTNPARPDEILGYFSKSNEEHAEIAIQASQKAFETWKHVPADERARYLLKAAHDMRRRKHEFSAVMVLEVGKSWVEADADTAEAIDFLEYYARQMMRIADSSGTLVPNPPEQLQLQYIPLGIGVVIPPWNFPNAIMAGMTSASIVAGNATIIKPASASPWIAYKVCELFYDNGLPDGGLNYLSGPGKLAGNYLVEHPQTRFIAFTGSMEVGIGIFGKASEVHPGQKWLKRTILEMGGKDGTVVDETADLDAAAQGIVAAAFGYQGQKCSAGSRAIIVDAVYDEVTSKVLELAEKITIGATDNGADVYLGPVVDKKAMKTIMDYIEIGKSEGKLLLGGERHQTPENGYFIQPTIFGDVNPEARIAKEEIFGPVLAMIRAKDFEDALNIANNTDYGLTGAVYSNNRQHLEQARCELHVGNLYLNRKCTGALVGVHPFGGFNMSGTDSKAGGPDYLLLFTQAKSIAEKL